MSPDGRKQVRLYKVWTGNNRFVCGGRVIFGPDAPSVLLTTLLISAPAITFIVQISLKILHVRKKSRSGHIDDTFHILGYPVLVATTLLTIANLCFLYLTSGRDPGIIPRNKRPPQVDKIRESSNASMNLERGSSTRLKLSPIKEVSVNGYTVKVKYCETCLLYRPPRASHCSTCDNCIERFDHHCPWVAQCIGLRNYRFFFLFISSSTFLCIYVFTLSWLNITCEMKNHHNSLLRSIRAEVASIVLIVYTFIAVWFVGGLTMFHLYLISTNQTTYENFRYRYDKKENPYNQGIVGNIKELFFSKIPPSENNFRSLVHEDSLVINSISANHDFIMNFTEKKDIESGEKLRNSDSMSIPGILQNLDYGSFDDLKDKSWQGNELEIFTFPLTEDNNLEESRDSFHSFAEACHAVVEGVADVNASIGSLHSCNSDVEDLSKRVAAPGSS